MFKFWANKKERRCPYCGSNKLMVAATNIFIGRGLIDYPERLSEQVQNFEEETIQCESCHKIFNQTRSLF